MGLTKWITKKYNKICNPKHHCNALTWLHYFITRRAIRAISNNKPYQIIFKADDLASDTYHVRKLDRFLQKENVTISWGVIGKSLEHPSYLQFLKEKLDDPKYHFFNHGYLHLGGPYEFYETSEEDQYQFLIKTQNIFKATCGYTLDCFGAPCNHIDENTARALERIPDIIYWYYTSFASSKKILPREVEIENGVGNLDFKFFKHNWESTEKHSPVILQIHPDLWQAKHHLEFALAIRYLKAQGCTFIRPNDIL